MNIAGSGGCIERWKCVENALSLDDTARPHKSAKQCNISRDKKRKCLTNNPSAGSLSVHTYMYIYIYKYCPTNELSADSIVEIVDVIKIAGVEAVNTVVTADPLYWCLLHLRACRREFSQNQLYTR